MTTQNDDYLWQRRYDIKIRALTNRIYYQERQRIFEHREGFIKATSIIAGSIALAKVSNQDVMQWCAAFITVTSTCSLVFGFGQKARESVKISTEWAQLERDIDLVGERHFTEQHINQWQARANDIEAGEPAANKLLLEKCFQRAAEALGGTIDKQLNFIQKHRPPLIIP